MDRELETVWLPRLAWGGAVLRRAWPVFSPLLIVGVLWGTSWLAHYLLRSFWPDARFWTGVASAVVLDVLLVLALVFVRVVTGRPYRLLDALAGLVLVVAAGLVALESLEASWSTVAGWPVWWAYTSAALLLLATTRWPGRFVAWAAGAARRDR